MTTATIKKQPKDTKPQTSHWRRDPPWGSVSSENKKFLSDQSKVLNEWESDLISRHWVFSPQNTIVLHPSRSEVKRSENFEQDEPMRVAATEQGAEPITCAHHWIIDPASGPESKGRCKKCGAEMVFQNYWNDEVFKENTNFLLDFNRWETVYEPKGEDSFAKHFRVSDEKNY